MSTRSYREAVDCLNSLQSNAAVLEAVRASGGRLSQFAMPEMLEYLGRIGYHPDQLNALNVIHITGTKGKGSTSAFTDSILRQAMPGWKIGLYTSPHLVAVRERIRIDGAPLSEVQFAKYFFEVWDRLKENDTRAREDTPPMPGYFRFITLLAFHAFLEAKVDATILEVGVGGTYDSTNVVPKPVVTGVTALGLDHVAVLGKTLKEIAWQKGGIFKEGVPAYTVVQPTEGAQVLDSRAQELKSSSFTIVPLNHDLDKVKLGLAGQHQLQNASLAVTLAREFLKKQSSFQNDQELPESFVSGLEKTRWPGRCQTVVDPKRSQVTWYLDGAHTVESLEYCIQWFGNPGVGFSLDASGHKDDKQVTRFLIFNCTSGRSGDDFLGKIQNKLTDQLRIHGREDQPEYFFDQVIFCTNVTYAGGHFKSDLATLAIPDSDLEELKTQHHLAVAWSKLYPSYPPDCIHVLPSVEHAVKKVEASKSDSDNRTQVLVTGSLHLVGGVIEAAGLSEVAL